MKTKEKPTEYSAWGKDRYKITTQKVPSSASHHPPNGLSLSHFPHTADTFRPTQSLRKKEGNPLQNENFQCFIFD